MKHGPSLTDRVMDFFRQHPAVWIEASRLEAPGGRQAWRTRTSEARRRFKASGEGDIVNRTRTQKIDGRIFTLSEYMFWPKAKAQPTPAQPHDLNAPWELR